jgi:hypothetical protein
MTLYLFERTRSEAGCMSDLLLDELIGGLLSERERRAARNHLLSCLVCRRRFTQIENAARIVLPALPRKSSWLAVTTLAAAAGVALAFVIPAPDAVRIKGGERLGFYVKEGGAMRRGAPQEIVHPGDQLRFFYSMGKERYVAVLSLDGAKRASVYYPLGARAVLHRGGQNVALPLATELDGTLGREIIFALFCDRPIDLEPIRAAMELGAEPGPPECSVDRIAIEKKEGRN